MASGKLSLDESDASFVGLYPLDGWAGVVGWWYYYRPVFFENRTGGRRVVFNQAALAAILPSYLILGVQQLGRKGRMAVAIIAAIFAGLNTLLLTWLTFSHRTVAQEVKTLAQNGNGEVKK